MSEDTIQDVAKEFGDNIKIDLLTSREKYAFCFEKGIQHHQKQSYSELEVLEIIDDLFHCYASSYRQEAVERFGKKFKK